MMQQQCRTLMSVGVFPQTSSGYTYIRREGVNQRDNELKLDVYNQGGTRNLPLIIGNVIQMNVIHKRLPLDSVIIIEVRAIRVSVSIH